ncbi:BQ5605_C013g07403 [Microbotryum silenes-dioicae]|uniref:BQ5605_C013g07403 protein n=1 Tax=Microbotryum silenes-dioicae TaxID=796604 RepID=A0A2X0NP74_9BASI|nr:BQ5605_C013g07403 [Microbotryum silenes-dioicae]
MLERREAFASVLRQSLDDALTLSFGRAGRTQGYTLMQLQRGLAVNPNGDPMAMTEDGFHCAYLRLHADLFQGSTETQKAALNAALPQEIEILGAKYGLRHEFETHYCAVCDRAGHQWGACRKPVSTPATAAPVPGASTSTSTTGFRVAGKNGKHGGPAALNSRASGTNMIQLGPRAIPAGAATGNKDDANDDDGGGESVASTEPEGGDTGKETLTRATTGPTKETQTTTAAPVSTPTSPSPSASAPASPLSGGTSESSATSTTSIASTSPRRLRSCEESTLRSVQDLGARSEPGASRTDLCARSEPGASARDLGARNEPGLLGYQPTSYQPATRVFFLEPQPLEPHTSITHRTMDSSPNTPSPHRDSSPLASSISDQIATLQAQLAALQASQPPAAAASQPTAAAVVANPATVATASKVVFPKHARLDGPKSFTNWLRQLRLALPNQLRAYVLDGVAPATWTADQLAARDDTAREIIVGSIDSADVSATLDTIPSDDLSAPRIFAALKARFAPDDATRTLDGRQRPLQKTLTTRGGGDQAEGRSTGRRQATEGQPRRGRGCEARSKSSISDFIANEIENEG